MSINQDNDRCPRCHEREKFFETFKKCFFCSKKHCNQCWTELQMSDDIKLLIDILPNVDRNQMKRICSQCLQILLQHTLKTFDNTKQTKNIDDDYQLAFVLSLSQQETENKSNQKRKFEDDKINIQENENILQKISESIEKFFNRAKSNYQRNRDALSDTVLLSTFIFFQTYSNELEQFKRTLHDQRQHLETLQEKLTALRDAREALNILRYEYAQKKQYEQEQRRLIMMKKVAELRQIKHTQIANYQQNYLQRLLDEEQQMIKRLNQHNQSE